MSALRAHWDIYLIEAWGLGTFMFVAGAVAALLAGAPAMDPIAVRSIFGIAMGFTVVALTYSPWGARSGAHLNPAVTLAFAWLGKIPLIDAAFYIVAQVAGGALGFGLATVLFAKALALPAVDYIVTKPGPAGAPLAFAAELGMTFVLMSVVLYASNAARPIARCTGVFAGVLVATYITFEAPISGMSLNPARTFASALPAHDWTAIWVYLVAPPVGMLVAAFSFAGAHGADAVRCAKVHHDDDPQACVFPCGYRDSPSPRTERPSTSLK